jgi:hypothetical protein
MEQLRSKLEQKQMEVGARFLVYTSEVRRVVLAVAAWWPDGYVKLESTQRCLSTSATIRPTLLVSPGQNIAPAHDIWVENIDKTKVVDCVWSTRRLYPCAG